MRNAVLFAAGLVPLLVGTARADVPPETITLVVVGDVGLNRNQLKVDPRGVLEGGRVLEWSDMTDGIRSLIDGDLNFMNLETVVTDWNDLAPGNKRQKKPYLFRTHPKGVEHLIDVGFNLISGANNHAYDYGERGVLETVKHLTSLGKARNVQFAGIGANQAEAAAPTFRDVGRARVAMSAIGIVTNMLKFHRATADSPGTLGYRYQDDWKLITSKLAAAQADVKLLSIHYGKEREVQCDSKQLDQWRWAVREQDADVVIGHHAHVVRGIELHKGKLIFYGLGNFLIRGARNMRSEKELRLCCDYGLLAKVHLHRERNGYRARAVEVVPIVDMHKRPRRWPVADSVKRIEVLNALGEGLDDPGVGSSGLRFQARDDGTGLWCDAGAKKLSGAIGALCANHESPARASKEVRNRVKRGSAPAQNRRKNGKKRSKRRRR